MRHITLHPCLLPYVTLADRSSLPKAPGVYYVISPWKPWSVLYVGMSDNMRSRWRGDRHHKLSNCMDYGNIRLYYRVLRSELAAERREAHDIRRFNPPWNGRIEKTPHNIFADILELASDAFWAIVLGASVAAIGLVALEAARQPVQNQAIAQMENLGENK